METKNTIGIAGKINSRTVLKHSKITNRPYTNFSIYVEPEDNPPFYMKIYASGDPALIANSLNIGQKVFINGCLESALLYDGSYGLQINCENIELL